MVKLVLIVVHHRASLTTTTIPAGTGAGAGAGAATFSVNTLLVKNSDSVRYVSVLQKVMIMK